MAVEGANLLEHIQTPALIVSNGQVSFANSAAKALLGGHIVGQDVRIAIRNPEAVAIIMGESGGTTKIDGLSVGGSVDAGEAWLAFRGRMPGVEALLAGRGLAD